jgi:DNA polymerase III alpha subunit
MPTDYANFDIAKWCLDQCNNDVELQRVGKELIMFQERNLLNLLCFLRYFVATMRENNIVWGVGRGSSVASYVLYLIGVHKVDSVQFDLDYHEFMR